MDQQLLVDRGRRLIGVMSANGLSPGAALWVHEDEADRWRLWIVPPAGFTDQFDFYRRLSEVVARNGSTLGDIDASNVELVKADHPAVRALSHMFGVRDGSLAISSGMLDGFYLSDAILLRTLQEASLGATS